jgi:hypothetical protein
MTIPFSLAAVFGAVLFWRITVWLGIEDFMYSWKGALVTLALMVVVAIMAAIL